MERESHQLAASCMLPPGDLVQNPGMCPGWESDHDPLVQAWCSATEPHWPGHVHLCQSQQEPSCGLAENRWRTMNSFTEIVEKCSLYLSYIVITLLESVGKGISDSVTPALGAHPAPCCREQWTFTSPAVALITVTCSVKTDWNCGCLYFEEGLAQEEQNIEIKQLWQAFKIEVPSMYFGLYSIIKHIYFLFTIRTVPEEEREAKFYRVITCSLLALKKLLYLLPDNELDSLEEKFKFLLSQNKFWKYGKHNIPQVS